MTPHTQLVRHDPDNGQYGDCFRTAIACLLDLPPEDVPHFNGPEYDEPGAQDHATREWLETRGLSMATVGFPSELPLAEFLPHMIHVVGGVCRFVLAGESPRGSCHAVVACTGGILHDPHPDGGGLVGPFEKVWTVTIIGRLV